MPASFRHPPDPVGGVIELRRGEIAAFVLLRVRRNHRIASHAGDSVPARQMIHFAYKILAEDEWARLKSEGSFLGSAVDLRDGYIHLSNARQAPETARRHFAGARGLTLAAFDAAAFGEALVYEPSRGGDLFPHLYGPLTLAALVWVRPLPWNGIEHVFPDLPPDAEP